MRLEVHGVGVEVCGAPELVSRVERDFSLFLAAGPARAPRLCVELSDRPLAARERAGWGSPVGRTKDACVHRRGSRQLFDSGAAAAVVWDFAGECGTIAGSDADLVHEKAYLLLMSRLGALLDRRGLHRVHAMGVARGGAGALCLLPMGGGKTTLALDLLERPEVELLSEEVPLVARDGALMPFPIRIGVVAGTQVSAPREFVSPFRRSRHGPKTLIDARWLAGRVAGVTAPRLLLVGRRTARTRPAVRRLAGREAWNALLRLCVLGIGLPQLLEYCAPWRARSALSVPPVLLSRLLACRALLSRCSAHELSLGSDRRANAELVLRLLDDLGAGPERSHTALRAAAPLGLAGRP